MTQNVVISGGGACGLLSAHALHALGLRVQVLEKRPLEQVHANDAADRRNIALTAASMQFLQTLGLDAAIMPHAQPIHDILVTDGTVQTGASPHYLHFARSDLPNTPAGYFIEQRHLLGALRHALPASLIDYNVSLSHTTAQQTHVDAHLCDGRILPAALLLCCEGRQSPLVQQLGLRALKRSYNHTAIVTAVQHEKPHYGLAHEYFLPSGPFAVLPMLGNRSSLVWVEDGATAAQLLSLPPEQFFAQLQQRFGTMYGDLTLDAPVSSYGLHLHVLYKPYSERIMVLGDAAHVVHPVAGQGFNLGVADVACVQNLLQQRTQCGLDVGSIDVLQQYACARRGDIWRMVAATDVITRLFSNNNSVLRVARRWGLTAVQNISPLRRAFMRKAAGV